MYFIFLIACLFKKSIILLSRSLNEIIWLGLEIGAGLFVQGVWKLYNSNLTSMAYSFEEVQLHQNPTIVICFQPSTKLSAFAKYNFTRKQLHELDIPNMNKSWIDFLKEISYAIGVDFDIVVRPNDDDQYITIQNSTLTNDQAKIIDLDIMNTIEAGLCYKLTPKFKTPKNIMNFVGIVFKPELIDEDIPTLKFIFTSSDNSY